MRIVAGVDCHKASHTVVFVDAVGHPVEGLTIPTTAEGYERALAVADQLGCVNWGLEGAGCYGFAFAVHIGAHGGTVFDVPGVRTRRERRHGSRRGKSDANDAQAIADVVLRDAGRLSQFHPPTVQRALRLLYDRRDRLVRERTRAANRLRMAAVLLGVMELPADLTATKTVRGVARSARRFRTQVRLNVATDVIVEEIEDAVHDIVRLNDRIRGVERRLTPLAREVAPHLLVVHGASAIVAAGLVGHAGDMRHYRDAAAFAAKCGTAPVPCSSGRHVAVRLNIGGDRQLNRLLHIIAMAQVRATGHRGREYYERKRAEGKTHRAAMRCLKRQLATVVYYRLLTTQEALMRASVPLATAA
jgi:transposase